MAPNILDYLSGGHLFYPIGGGPGFFSSHVFLKKNLKTVTVFLPREANNYELGVGT